MSSNASILGPSSNVLDLTEINSDEDEIQIAISQSFTSRKRRKRERPPLASKTTQVSATIDLLDADYNDSGKSTIGTTTQAAASRSLKKCYDVEDLTESPGTAAQRRATETSSKGRNRNIPSRRETTTGAAKRISSPRPIKYRYEDNSDNDIKVISISGSKTKPEKQITPMLQILEVFPDVDLAHVRTLMVQYGLNSTRANDPVVPSQESNIQLLMSQLAENSYPKTEGISDPSPILNHVVQRGDGLRSHKHDYMLESAFTPTVEYVKQCGKLLLTDFPFLTKVGVKVHLKASKNHYAICHQNICNAIKGSAVAASGGSAELNEEECYNSIMGALSGKKISSAQKDRLCDPLEKGTKMTLTVPRKAIKSSPFQVTESILLDEVDYVKKKLSEWKREIEKRIERREARKASERNGSTMECLCCYSDVALEEMISCKEGHLFCVDCLRRYTESKVFSDGNLGIDKKSGGLALALVCMAAECPSGFGSEHLRKALPAKTMAKHDELEFAAAVQLAGIEDIMFTCPKCDYRAELPETENVFRCPVECCGHEACRKCGEPPHIPLRCEEVEKKHETDGRRKVEEAITAAKIRSCPRPKCGKKFIKDSGCNKMTCACGTHVCYVCRIEIPKEVGYRHFCQVPHCQHKSCNGCSLYSNNEEDDEREMRQAGIHAAEEVRGDSLTNVGDDASKMSAVAEVRIDVDNMLKNPNPNAAAALPRRRLNAEIEQLIQDAADTQRRIEEMVRSRADARRRTEEMARSLGQLDHRLQQQPVAFLPPSHPTRSRKRK